MERVSLRQNTDALVDRRGRGLELWVAADGGDGRSGRTERQALASMAEAFDRLAAQHTKTPGSAHGSTIHLSGPIFENASAPRSVSGITIQGFGGGLRHGSLTNVAEGYAPAWRTASGVTASPLLTLTTQGVRILDILMAPPSAAAAIKLVSDGAADPEKTLSGLVISNVRFPGGKYAIEDSGGAGFVTVRDGCRFEGQTTTSIECTSTSNALPLQWQILDSYFGYLSAAHIKAAASHWLLRRNVFATVASSGKYIDFTGGANNVVAKNILGGVYDTSDYVAGTSDIWLQNAVAAKATTAPDGLTLVAPGA